MATTSIGTSGVTFPDGTTQATAAAGGVTSFSAGTTGLTPSTGTTGAVTLAGKLAITNGGTGANTAATARTALGVPANDGTGATGTWGISISGTVATANALSTASGSAPSYSARAWVNFNGTGTIAIRASGNVQSITDGGTGIYTVVFNTAMQDDGYATLVTGNTAQAGATGYTLVRANTAQSTLSVGIVYLAGNQNYGGSTDFAYSNVAIFR